MQIVLKVFFSTNATVHGIGAIRGHRGRHDIQYNDTYPNDTRHNDMVHIDAEHSETQHNDKQHNDNAQNTQHKHAYNDADC